MSKTLQNLSSMSIHPADLTELQYATKLREAESESEFGFSHLDLRLLHLGSSLFNGLTSVGAGFSMALIIGQRPITFSAANGLFSTYFLFKQIYYIFT
jgi:hypothetical protein